jgi:hypothetical protein
MYKLDYSKRGKCTICINHGEASVITQQIAMRDEPAVYYVQGTRSIAYVAVTISQDGEQPELVDGFRLIGPGMIRLVVPPEQTLCWVKHTEHLMFDWYHRDTFPWVPVT